MDLWTVLLSNKYIHLELHLCCNHQRGLHLLHRLPQSWWSGIESNPDKQRVGVQSLALLEAMICTFPSCNKRTLQKLSTMMLLPCHLPAQADGCCRRLPAAWILCTTQNPKGKKNNSLRGWELRYNLPIAMCLFPRIMLRPSRAKHAWYANSGRPLCER